MIASPLLYKILLNDAFDLLNNAFVLLNDAFDLSNTGVVFNYTRHFSTFYKAPYYVLQGTSYT